MEKIRLKAFLHTFVLALLLAPVLATAATTYTWVDDQGVTHFSQFPPEHGEVRVINPYVPRPVTPPAEAKSPDAMSAEPAEPPRPAESSAEEQAVKQQLETVRADNCRKARANLNTLTTGGRLRYTDAEGNVRFLTDEERQARIEEAQGQIEEYCTE
ncbi:DUF4124 domain-containing protein [Thioalbus denitrificans]|uniref:Uncharacterized protein DUF4124 n=1 Tax=Thioalbus denitrificans TaxID=547122 RepID=A0A369CB44_9GAMM|nr:DUF4124 domain-containing protein [Thioalbus denitrificans]RCX29857.1 uncharacterized protein DUF4124 [Thioalbus denitrificans]